MKTEITKSLRITQSLLFISLLSASANMAVAKPNTDNNQSPSKGDLSEPDTYPESLYIRPFKIKVRTSNSGKTTNTQYEIPTEDGGYNYKVDCDSDGIIEASNVRGDYVCNYATPGDYTISISGEFPQISHYYEIEFKDSPKIISIEQWGSNQWRSMKHAFLDCINLTSNATDQPDLSRVTDMSSMFTNARSFNGDISDWDVSNVTNMKNMFWGAVSFNQDNGNWNVSNVTDMSHMFTRALVFNQDIGNWDVSNVTDMSFMFSNSSFFNQDIGNWDVSNVTNMDNMFSGAYAFNQSLNKWDVSNVTNMVEMFAFSTSFNNEIGNWDVSNVTDMSYFFSDAESFNQDIGNWDVSNVTNMERMFHNTITFNQDIDDWNVSNVTTMASMFANADAFNQDIGNWDVGKVRTMHLMFWDANAFIQNLGNWDISNLRGINFIFRDTALSIFNYNNLLNGWSRLPLKSTVSFSAVNTKYSSAGSAARQKIIDDFNWRIEDGGYDDRFDLIRPQIPRGNPFPSPWRF